MRYMRVGVPTIFALASLGAQAAEKPDTNSLNAKLRELTLLFCGNADPDEVITFEPNQSATVAVFRGRSQGSFLTICYRVHSSDQWTLYFQQAIDDKQNPPPTVAYFQRNGIGFQLQTHAYQYSSGQIQAEMASHQVYKTPGGYEADYYDPTSGSEPNTQFFIKVTVPNQ